MDREQLKNDIRKIISQVTELDTSKIHDLDNLVDDLGIESVMILDIMMEIEDKFSVRIPQEKYDELDSLDAVTSLLDELISQQTTS